jgi:3'-phosphoadenosine 5'-phosphosulfate (PAPS) 3'-phosphatase
MKMDEDIVTIGDYLVSKFLTNDIKKEAKNNVMF